jgi:hypothetical protein
MNHDADQRDAIVSFQCYSPDFVQVSEMVDGQAIHHQGVTRHPDVVTEMEKKYIFFARHASLARRQVMHGQSCCFSVFFREP